LRRSGTPIAVLEEKEAGSSLTRPPPSSLTTTAGRRRSRRRRRSKPPLGAAPTHRSKSASATTRSARPSLHHPPPLTTTDGQRGRQRARAAAIGEQQAGRDLFHSEVADSAVPFSDHRSQGRARSGPKHQIGPQRTGDPRLGKLPTPNKQRKRKVLTTPAPPLVHLRPANQVDRIWARPALRRRGLSYRRLGESEEGEGRQEDGGRARKEREGVSLRKNFVRPHLA
jgi:hypothetical protein